MHRITSFKKFDFSTVEGLKSRLNQVIVNHYFLQIISKKNTRKILESRYIILNYCAARVTVELTLRL